MRTLAIIAALSLGACVTLPTVTEADRAAVANLRPETKEAGDLCASYLELTFAERARRCAIATMALQDDPAATPTMIQYFAAETRRLQNRAGLASVLEGALLGPERVVTTCYRGECTVIRYRTDHNGIPTWVDVH